MFTFLRPRSLDLAQDAGATLTWGGVGMLTFLRPRSLDLAQDADATLALGGVGWSGGCLRSFDHVPSTLHKMLMLRSHRVGWSGVGMLTFLRPRSLDLAQDADARLTWGRVGWGCLRSFDHVPLTLHKMLMLRSHGVGWGRVGWGCLRSFDHVPLTLHKMLMLRSHGVGWGRVGWGCLRSFDHVPSTLHKMLMLRSHGVGWGGVGMLTFLRPPSLDLAQDADARLTWGIGWSGVGMLTFLRSRSLDLAQDADATLTWGGVGWGC